MKYRAQENKMTYRVIILALLFSMNANAKPAHHSTGKQDKIVEPQNYTQTSEDDLTNQLTNHRWQITQIMKQPGFSFNADHWYFNFAANGRYKAFGSCNYLSGHFKSDNAGTFRISNLDGSNNHCANTKDEEAMVFNMPILADNFVINGETMLLKSNGQPLIEFKVTERDIKSDMTNKNRHEKKSEKPNIKKSKHKKDTQAQADGPSRKEQKTTIIRKAIVAI